MGLEPPAAMDRWPAIDVARGLAIVAMVIYHFAWDLSFVRLIATDIIGHPAWRLFARMIAGSFLVLVGIGLVLAHGERVRRRSFIRRLAVIGGAALAITLVTRIAVPGEYIFFGILHCIAVSSVLALPFLRAPLAALAGAAGICFAAPLVFTTPALDTPLLDWLGLGSSTPATNDYVPIFPWFGFVLIGIGAGRLLHRSRENAPSWSPSLPWWKNRLAQALIWSGRYSLIIYLAHQPLLLGGLLVLVQATGSNPAAEAAAFERECKASCLASGTGEARCIAGCACALQDLQRSGTRPQTVGPGASPADEARLSSVIEQCFRNEPGRIQ
jgi:uncharacterized membrane protein